MSGKLWKQLDLGGDDDVDYNGGHVINGLDALAEYLVTHPGAVSPLPLADINAWLKKVAMDDAQLNFDILLFTPEYDWVPETEMDFTHSFNERAEKVIERHKQAGFYFDDTHLHFTTESLEAVRTLSEQIIDALDEDDDD